VLSQVVGPAADGDRVDLLGHSFGGVLAYEYAIRHPERLRSLVLSNAPTSMRRAGDEYDRLERADPAAFWRDHACRVGIPPALEDAFQHAGSVWVGMDAVADYAASPIPDDGVAEGDSFPRTLVISGSRDFGYQASNEGAWREVLSSPSHPSRMQAINIQDGAHYPFYEDGKGYASILEGFLYSRPVSAS